ncbi:MULTISPECIES: MBOAT family protein [Aestuariivivens]|uniref:MBOAT family O-acyltransferase n=1 Tax=Aestuariivivens TaxID=1820275 RepID=UPI001CBB7C3A|nr:MULTISPECIES: MBOAT family O-acyltransferase [Aestuariivivens]
MLFNSLDFALFLPIVFLLYWFVFRRHLILQNAFIVIASYLFYGWWDWRFLGLIIFSTIVDFFVGFFMAKQFDANTRKILLLTSIIVNIGLLGFFKYYNFFISNFVEAFSLFGTKIEANSLNIILPVGISFYTFQTLSYSIDIYKGKLKPTQNLIAFAAFVSFFPQLVAGPIERAKNLLPQFYKKRNFVYNQAVNGLRQILWGLFKKVVIADNCAQFVNLIFDNYTNYSASTLLLGAVFFAFQIYGDFSGYSDIAIGTARLFGFDLKQNFAFPYFSRDIAEFWRRWHISLSTWFRDYIYIPLGGSRGSKLQQVRNVFIVFLISAFWHGANWTFIAWGALHAFYFVPLLIMKKNRAHLSIVAQNKRMPKIKDIILMLLTFVLTTLAWVFFRAETLSQGFDYMVGLYNDSLFTIPQVRPTYLIIFIAVFLIIEWCGRHSLFAIEHLWLKYPRIVRWTLYYIIAISIFLYGGKEQEFIYFQF